MPGYLKLSSKSLTSSKYGQNKLVVIQEERKHTPLGSQVNAGSYNSKVVEEFIYLGAALKAKMTLVRRFYEKLQQEGNLVFRRKIGWHRTLINLLLKIEEVAEKNT